MPPRIQGLTLRQIFQNTYLHHREMFMRVHRDKLKMLRIRKVTVYNGKDPGQARTKYVVESRSTPQYAPYYTKKDSRGRERSYQARIRHQYDVTLQMDKLSIDSPVKFRTGSERKWDFSPTAKVVKDSRGKIVRDDKNVLNGRNGAFFFFLEYALWESGNLYGRNFTNGPPLKTNPRKIIYFDKHALNVVLTLFKMSYIKR